jgi:hypothetical protein
MPTLMSNASSSPILTQIRGYFVTLPDLTVQLPENGISTGGSTKDCGL